MNKRITSIGMRKNGAFIEASNGKEITNTSVDFLPAENTIILSVNAYNDPTVVRLQSADTFKVSKSGVSLDFDYQSGVSNLSVNTDLPMGSANVQHDGKNFLGSEFELLDSVSATDKVVLGLGNGSLELKEINALCADLSDNLLSINEPITTSKETISGLSHFYIPNTDNIHALDKLYYKTGTGDDVKFQLLFKDFEGVDSSLVFFKPGHDFEINSVKVPGIHKIYEYKNGNFEELSGRFFQINPAIKDLGNNVDLQGQRHHLFREVFSNNTSDAQDFSQGYYVFTAKDSLAGDHSQEAVYHKKVFDGALNELADSDQIFYKAHSSGKYHELHEFDGERVAFEKHSVGTDLYVRYDYNDNTDVLEINPVKVHYYKSGEEYRPINTNGNLIVEVTREVLYETASASAPSAHYVHDNYTTNNVASVMSFADSAQTVMKTSLGFFKSERGVSNFYEYDAGSHSVAVDDVNYYYHSAIDDNYLRISDNLPADWKGDPNFHLFMLNNKIGYYQSADNAELAVKGILKFVGLDGTQITGDYYKNTGQDFVKIDLPNNSSTLTVHNGNLGYYVDPEMQGIYKFVVFDTYTGSENTTLDTGFYYQDNGNFVAVTLPADWSSETKTLLKLNDQFGYFDSDLPELDSSSKIFKFVTVDVHNGNTAVQDVPLYFNAHGLDELTSYAKIVDENGQNVTIDQLQMVEHDVGRYTSSNDELFRFQKLKNPNTNVNSSDTHKWEVTFHNADDSGKVFYYLDADGYHTLNFDFALPESAVVKNIENVWFAWIDGLNSRADGLYFGYAVDPISGKIYSMHGPDVGYFKKADGSFVELNINPGNESSQWNAQTDTMVKIGDDYGRLQAKDADFENKGVFQLHKLDHTGTGNLSVVDGKWYQADGQELAFMSGFSENYVKPWYLGAEPNKTLHIVCFGDDNSDNVHYGYAVNDAMDGFNQLVDISSNPATYYYDQNAGIFRSFNLPINWDSGTDYLVSTTEFSKNVGMDAENNPAYVKLNLAAHDNVSYISFFADKAAKTILSDSSVMVMRDSGAYKNYVLDSVGAVSESKFFADSAKTINISAWWQDNSTFNTLSYDADNDQYNYVRKTEQGVFRKGALNADGTYTDVDGQYYTDIEATILIAGDWSDDHMRVGSSEYAAKTDTNAWQKGTFADGDVDNSATFVVTTNADPYFTDSSCSTRLQPWSENYQLLSETEYSLQISDGFFRSGGVSDLGVLSVDDGKRYVDDLAQNEIVGWNVAKHEYISADIYSEKNADGTYAKGAIAADGSTMTLDGDGTLYVKSDASIILNDSTVTWTANHFLIDENNYKVFDSIAGAYQKGSVNAGAVDVADVNQYYNVDSTEIVNFTANDFYISDSEVYRKDMARGPWIKNNLENNASSDYKYYNDSQNEIVGFIMTDIYISDDEVYRKDNITGVWLKNNLNNDAVADANYYTQAKVQITDFTANDIYVSDAEIYRQDTNTGAWQKNNLSNTDTADNNYYTQAKVQITDFTANDIYVSDAEIYRQDSDSGAWLKNNLANNEILIKEIGNNLLVVKISDNVYGRVETNVDETFNWLGFYETSDNAENEIAELKYGGFQEYNGYNKDLGIIYIKPLVSSGLGEKLRFMDVETAQIYRINPANNADNNFLCSVNRGTSNYLKNIDIDLDKDGLKSFYNNFYDYEDELPKINYYTQDQTQISSFISNDIYISDTEIYRKDSDTGAWTKNNLANDAVVDGNYYTQAKAQISSFTSEDIYISDIEIYRKDSDTGAWLKNNLAHDTADDGNYYTQDQTQITNFTSEDRYVSDTEIYRQDTTNGAWQKSNVDTSDTTDTYYYTQDKAQITAFSSNDRYISDSEIYRQDVVSGAWLKNNLANDSVADGNYYTRAGLPINDFSSEMTLIDNNDETYSYSIAGSDNMTIKGDVDAGGNLAVEGYYYTRSYDNLEAKLIAWDPAQHTLLADDNYLLKVDGFEDLWHLGVIDEFSAGTLNAPINAELFTSDGMRTNKYYFSTYYTEQFVTGIWGRGDVSDDGSGNKTLQDLSSFYSDNVGVNNQDDAFLIKDHGASNLAYASLSQPMQLIYNLEDNVTNQHLHYYNYADVSLTHGVVQFENNLLTHYQDINNDNALTDENAMELADDLAVFAKQQMSAGDVEFISKITDNVYGRKTVQQSDPSHDPIFDWNGFYHNIADAYIGDNAAKIIVNGTLMDHYDADTNLLFFASKISPANSVMAYEIGSGKHYDIAENVVTDVTDVDNKITATYADAADPDWANFTLNAQDFIDLYNSIA